jgi:DNA-binding NarL/FixJ family response regulator
MNLLPQISKTNPNFSAAISWLSTSGINLKIGVVSNRHLFLYALYHLAYRKLNICFMATSQSSAMEEIKQHKPGLLIVTADLEHGDSGVSIIDAAKQIDNDLRSVLIVDCGRDNLKLAYRSKADAVICEHEVFSPEAPQDRLVFALALGKRFRSPLLKQFVAAKQPAAEDHLALAPESLTGRELEVAALLIEGLNDLQIADRLAMAYATVRSHGRSLRRKFGVTHRSQLVLRLLEHGKDRLQRHSSGGVNPSPR